jgi:uncharacterized Ntn-hydrolase superfamily protein
MIPTPNLARARRSLLVAMAMTLCGPRALATWSILVVDTQTNEVCVASATCLDGFPLKRNLGLVLVGKGAAAAQSAVDSAGVNRGIIWEMMNQGFSPAQILVRLETHGTNFQQRQYGIVTLAHDPVTFTGNNAGQAKYGIAARSDNLSYAIQGNVLAGILPVYAAEQAILSTAGDLGQKVIAAMEAARAAGGDGRCSCSNFQPTSCGAPPPNMVYSASTAFMVLARMGDVDGVCSVTPGCANGQYYLDLNTTSSMSDGLPEPVLAMEQRYLQWRALLAGSADHVKSLVAPLASTLPADGVSSTTVDVQLLDLEGDLATRSAILVVEPTNAVAAQASVGALVDHGDGHHSFAVVAGTQAGTATWKITARHHEKDVRLWPDLAIELQ